MLTALRIENFRKFENFQVDFAQRNLLVGPNNAGKSTVIEALRLVSILVNRFGSLNFEAPPEWLEGLEAARGVSPSTRGLDFDLGRETFHHYAEPPAILEATFSGGGRVRLYVGPGAEIFAVIRDGDGGEVTTKREAKSFELDRIGIQPQVGPLARHERPLADRYVKGSLDSTLAPTHFRNQLRLLDHHFEVFKTIAEQTWPALRIDGVELSGLGEDLHLELYLRDGPFVGEAAGMGHGLQMWLQLMWFLARSAGDGTVVLDEPDVYMHPDLQRRLIRFLLRREQQVIVATHSIEMMSEVEPHELLPIDSTRRSARRARDLRDVQRVVEQVGGVHNLEFARLTRADRFLIAPSADVRLLKRCYDLVNPDADEPLDLLPSFPIDTWDDWPFAVAMKRAIDATRDERTEAICLLPPGLATEAEVERLRDDAARNGIDLHVWKRRTTVNYLLTPDAISRAAARAGKGEVTAALVAGYLRRILSGLRAEVARDCSVMGRFEAEWQTLDGQLRLVPGRLVLLRLAARLRVQHDVTIGMPDIQRALEVDDLDGEIVAVLRAVADGASIAGARAAATGTTTWSDSSPEVLDVDDAGSEEILDLFEEAGLFGAAGGD
ncbi:MAG: AAA family ATPase [Solirubrobacteraceae bacterium MAG38_C4-C5]|nr:AAA family ATPase [Candidatus Siliceabacter maunaloa]